jgi:ankyrin repeat protein
MPSLVSRFLGWQWEREYRRKQLLIKAAERGDTTSVRRLLDEGVDINATVDGRYPWTPLMHVAFEGHEDTVRALLDRGADPHHGDRDGAMAITVSAGCGH